MLSAHFDECRSQSALPNAIPFFPAVDAMGPANEPCCPGFSADCNSFFPAVDAGHDSQARRFWSISSFTAPFRFTWLPWIRAERAPDFRKSQKDLRTMFGVAGLKQHHQPRTSLGDFLAQRTRQR
jgi:hypothetical protein